MSPRQARDAVDAAARRTVDRASLRRAHPGFDAVSPAVGTLDPAALTAELRRDADAGAALLADLAVATDPVLRAQARALARRVLPRLGATGTPRRRGPHRLVARSGELEGDLDLERSLERTAARRPREAGDLVTRRFAAAPRTVCLLVDRSGSMGGHAVALAAVAAAAVVSAAAPGRLRCGVIAFASETLVLHDPAATTPPDRVIDDLLSLRGRGRTDLAGALRAAAALLAPVAPGGRTAILLSDGVHTKGADPLPAAGLLDRLDVLGTSPEPDALAAGRALAGRGRGRYAPARSVAELTIGLERALR